MMIIIIIIIIISLSCANVGQMYVKAESYT